MTFETVAKLLAEYKDCDVSTISMETSFTDLELDSLDKVEIVMNLEDKFGTPIEISGDIKTVGELVELIDKAKA